MIERVDDIGGVMQLPGPAHCIVCLVPSITETLFAFGAGPGVVGITDYCVHPSQEVQAKTKIGGSPSSAFPGSEGSRFLSTASFVSNKCERSGLSPQGNPL